MNDTPPGLRRGGAIRRQTLTGDDAESTEGHQLRLYLGELERQSQLFSKYHEAAWVRGIGPDTAPDDVHVWGDLQAALFAAIVIERLLNPVGVRARPKLGITKHAAEQQATRRASRLQELLDLTPSDLNTFSVKSVRDSLEHIDERFDALIIHGAKSVTDWFISRGASMMTVGPHGENVGSRVFFPAAGFVFFERDALNLFTLDLAMRDMRLNRIPKARETLDAVRGSGNNVFDGILVNLFPNSDVDEFVDYWIREREKLGEPLPYKFVETDQ